LTWDVDGYDAFISYRRKDGLALARWIRRKLRHFELPRQILDTLSESNKAVHNRRPRIWLDQAYEKSHDDFLNKKVYPALDASCRLIVVSTPSAFEMLRGSSGGEEPNWLMREIDRFISAGTVGIESRPIDIVVGPRGSDIEFPGRLAEKPRWDWVDLRAFTWWRAFGFSEHLDAGLAKLVAGLYDVPEQALPELRREERRRRNKLLGAIAGAATAVAITIGALAVIAVQQKNEAERQRNEAVARLTAAQADRLLSDDSTQLERSALIGAYSLSRRPSLQANIVAQEVLRLLPKPLLAEQIGESHPIAEIAGDAQHVALATYDGRLTILDVRTRMLSNVHADVTKLALDAAGTGIIVGTKDGSVLAYDFRGGDPRIIGRVDGAVTTVAVDRRGALVVIGTGTGPLATVTAQATAGLPAPSVGWLAPSPVATQEVVRSGSATIFRTDSRQLVKSFPTSARVRALSFSDDSRLLAIGDESGKLQVIELDTGRTVVEHNMHGVIGEVSFSADSSYVATGTTDTYTAAVIHIADNRVTGTVGDNGTVNNIVFNPNAPVAYIATVRSHLRAIDASTGQVRWSLPTEGVYALAISPDGKSLAAGFASRAGLGTVRVLDAVTGIEVARKGLPQYIVRIAFYDEGRKIAAVSFDGSVSAFDPATTSLIAHHRFAANFVQIGALGRTIALASIGSNRLVDLRSGQELLSFPGGTGSTGRVALTLDERFFVSAAPDGAVTLYDIDQKRPLWTVREEGFVDAIAFSPDGSRLVTASKGTASIRSAATGETTKRLPYAGVVDSAAMSGDSRYLALCEIVRGSGAKVRVVDMSTQQDHMTIESDLGCVVAFSPDSSRLASASFNRKLHLVDITLRRPLWTREYQSYVRAVAFSSDGRSVLGGAEDGSVQLRDTETGNELSRTTEPGSVRAVQFIGTGQEYYVAALGSEQLKEQLWLSRHVHRPDDLIAESCARA
jgi:WD40 repeat protein